MHGPFAPRGFSLRREASAALSAGGFGFVTTARSSHSPSEDTAPLLGTEGEKSPPHWGSLQVQVSVTIIFRSEVGF